MNIGDKISFLPAGRLIMNQFRAKWGETFWLFVVPGDDGNTYKFFHSARRAPLMISDGSRISGVVKGFDEYKGQPQVVLKNVRVEKLVLTNCKNNNNGKV